ncbi:F0F1 ATP synthase subunit B [Candidatus Saccharibacteria bacterium]|nr:F0F1 ATP synthase subunit B [Candidatus Saccharibacteria bacterium]
MIQTLTLFGADSTSGIGALGINAKSLIIQLLTFLFAYLVLRKFAFKPILKVLDDRRQTIEGGVKLGEEMKLEKAQLESEVKKTLAAARKQADGIVADANDAARDAVRAAEEKAREKADNIVKDAQARTEQDANRVRTQIEKEVISLISDATEAIIGEKLDGTKDTALINRVLKEQRA